MRRFKIFAWILLILSVISFVLAASVAVQEVREACTDAVGGGDNVTIERGKRADNEVPPSSPSQHQGSSSAPNTDPNPSFSSGESKPSLLSTSGGNEL
jgi:hypothetical protein